MSCVCNIIHTRQFCWFPLSWNIMSMSHCALMRRPHRSLSWSMSSTDKSDFGLTNSVPTWSSCSKLSRTRRQHFPQQLWVATVFCNILPILWKVFQSVMEPRWFPDLQHQRLAEATEQWTLSMVVSCMVCLFTSHRMLQYEIILLGSVRVCVCVCMCDLRSALDSAVSDDLWIRVCWIFVLCRRDFVLGE